MHEALFLNESKLNRYMTKKKRVRRRPFCCDSGKVYIEWVKLNGGRWRKMYTHAQQLHVCGEEEKFDYTHECVEMAFLSMSKKKRKLRERENPIFLLDKNEFLYVRMRSHI